jgi:hypothetical protein
MAFFLVIIPMLLKKIKQTKIATEITVEQDNPVCFCS